MFILGKHFKLYVSKVDAFIREYESKRTDKMAAEGRQKEVQKHRALFNKRDVPVEESRKLWEEF